MAKKNKMLSILISCIYISLLCWTWGLATRDLLIRITREKILLPFGFTCLLGLVMITVIAGFLSIFLPLGGFLIQLFFLVPALFIALQKSTLTEFRKHLDNFRKVNRFLIFYFFSAVLLLLVMGSWIIYHPDTMAYHLQLIKWIEEYKAVPGLIHLDARYGLQSSWFVSCALFRFNFTNTGALTYINITILVWYLLFIVSKINSCFFLKPVSSNRLFWLILPIFNFWSYTQIRLTATSASPDFIAFIFISAVFYLLLSDFKNKSTLSTWVLILLFTAFSITIKFSTFPLMIVGVYALFRLIQWRKIKLLVISGVFSLLIVLPFLTRNLIASGYAFYPSTFANLFSPDWKYSSSAMKLQEKYITAYARTAGGDTSEEINHILSMSFNEWGPVWWSNRSLADKAIIFLAVLSILICIIFIKKIMRADQSIKMALLTALLGTVFWFIKAPDPRFGFGFIMMLPILVCIVFLNTKWTDSIIKKLAIGVVLISGLALNLYTAYRFDSFFTSKQIIRPVGFEKTEFKDINCGETIYHLAEKNNPCGNTPIPCILDSCQRFQQWGKTIEEGFRAR